MRALTAERPLLLLTTTGAKTGRTRQTTLGWFPDEVGAGDTWLIVASAAGAASHPSWCVNLARRPDGTAVYGKYAEQTDREIPVVRLTPRR